jgi:hypothetical protein
MWTQNCTLVYPLLFEILVNILVGRQRRTWIIKTGRGSQPRNTSHEGFALRRRRGIYMTRQRGSTPNREKDRCREEPLNKGDEYCWQATWWITS